MLAALGEWLTAEITEAPRTGTERLDGSAEELDAPIDYGRAVAAEMLADWHDEGADSLMAALEAGGDLTDEALWRLWRLDVGGDTLWCHGYDRGGANNYQMAGDLRITADSCFIVVGEAETLGSGVNDAWILKIEEDCRAGVEKSPEEVTGQAICRLEQNHPNPFGERTLISFQLAQPGRVSLGVYNPAGESVCALIDGWLPPGDHVATWDATQFAPGAYLLRLAVDGAESAVTAVLVK